ncbi:branched-chain amino acid ABC transporter substrate-binding protein [Lichenibacterium minor]|uniref:Branched-chain amino acid ABC transporter substrate-binding protein n=1 Tax=Lichenibacterium minor TaxID=2316528 RepID=A0A4Q2UA80_9HYPH|nr:branched-chain amino acid ABC transporter substrate-binding protein [Lichenibacterium minor]RYC33769.1 branched-chain amino acid ABC transporter substrate-binding protein [Lichenibacterium minor]
MKTFGLTGYVLAAGLAFSGAAHAADFKLGVAGPITGPNAAFGAQLQQGTQQAVDDLNAKGGILGNKITLEVGDDQSDPKQGVSVANKFVGDGVKYVVGDFNSGVSIPSSAVYNENGILQITPASTNVKFTEQGFWNTFRTCGRDDQQGEVAAKYIADHFKGKKIAILHDKTTYGKGLADATMADLAKVGIKPALYEGVNAGEKDYSAVVSKVKAAGADVVYWGGLHPEGGLIRRQMTDQGIKAPMMSGDGITDNEFASIAGPGAEGTLMTFGPEPRKNAAAATAVKELTAKGFDPQAYTLYSYAAVQVMAQAAEAAKSVDPHKMADKMHSGMVFHTVEGDLSFDKNGDLSKAGYVMYTWKKMPDGKITYVEND